jgi:hypothetical protein
MPSSPIERTGPQLDDVLAIAARLSGERVIGAAHCGGGGNNRVYRVQTPHATFALKSYGSAELDDRDRLAHEFDGLRFLKASGVGKAVPEALAVDRGSRCALYEWIEGAVPASHGPADVAAALEVLAALHRARTAEGASQLPPATEAVLHLSDLMDQIESRLARLAALTPADPELTDFIADEVRPEFRRRTAGLSDRNVDAELAREQQTISPSDFGFHNALRRADGSLGFIDFEYFGWDDPVKLTADFLWHPAMRLSEPERRQFLAGVTGLYGGDADFLPRLAVCFPLYGIRWSLIILNEYLPKLWGRRTFSGKGGDWAAAKREQLLKARAKLAAVRSYKEGKYT